MKNIRTDVVKKSLDDFAKIGEYIKENTSATVQNLLREAVTQEYVKIMSEAYDNDDDDTVEDDNNEENIEIKDTETEDTSNGEQESDVTVEDDVEEDTDGQEGEESDSEEGTEDIESDTEIEESTPEDWADYSDYQKEVGEYDFTNADDETIVKVWKLLKNSDDIEVHKDDSKLELKDNQTGAEYLIDLDSACNGGSCPCDDTEGDEGDTSFGDDDLEDNMNESKNRMIEIVLNEGSNLGYTPNYQKNDPITTPSMKEPGKNVNDWDAGVPKGKSKPWPGKGTEKKGKPFNEEDEASLENDSIEESADVTEKTENSWGLNHTPKQGNKVPVKNASTWGTNKNSKKPTKKVNECGDACMEENEDIEEATNVGGFVQQNSTSKSHVPNSSGRNARNASKGGSKIKGTADPRYSGSVSESMIKKHNKIVAENKEMKKTLSKLENLVKEAAVTNLNLGQIVKLFNENATTKDEKREIIARFGKEAKTIQESKELYAKISNELQKKNVMNINEEKQFTTESSNKINENTIYASKDLMASLDLMRKICK